MSAGCLAVRTHISYRQELADLMSEATANKSYRLIARDAEVSPSTIGNMVLGRVPSREVCERVANAAGVPLPQMLKAAGYGVTNSVEAVEVALRAADDLSDMAKADLMRMVKEFTEQHKKKD